METPLPAASEASAEPAQMSLVSRLFNVIVAPGELFDFVKGAKVSAANWLLPALLLIVVSWAGGWFVLSKDFSKQQLNDMTMQALDKQLAKMPADRAEQMRDQMVKYAEISQKISIAALPVVTAFASPFLWGLIVWLVGTRALKGSFGYMKAVEAVGLSNVVTLLDSLVTTLLILAMGNILARPSLALLIKDPDPQKTIYAVLGIFNVMTFWLLAVRSIALARLSSVSFAKAAVWVFGIWAAYTGLMVGGGLLIKLATGT
jgi:hypothetical protein